MPLTPKNRKEEWLQGLVDHETSLTPKNRPEEWMKEIIDASGGGGGTGGGVLVVGIIAGENDSLVMDKTFGEIKGSITTMPVVFQMVQTMGENMMVIPWFFQSLTDYNGKTINLIQTEDDNLSPVFAKLYAFAASTDNDYPTYTP